MGMGLAEHLGLWLGYDLIQYLVKRFVRQNALLMGLQMETLRVYHFETYLDD